MRAPTWRRCAPRAERDGDDYVINGQKVWTSYAHIAQWGILLARTDPTATKHAGISYFVCPMRAPGIEVRALVDMTGEHAFNEVFFTDVRIPADHLVGAENGGWELAKVTLGNERVSLSGEGACCGGWGRRRMISSSWSGASRPAWAGGVAVGGDGKGEAVVDAGAWARAWAWAWATLWSIPWAWAWAWASCGRSVGVGVGVGVGDAVVDPAVRDRLVSVWMESEILRVLRLRTVSAVLAGRSPGAEASVRKAIADAHGQHVMGLGRDLAGANGMLRGTAPVAAAAGTAPAGTAAPARACRRGRLRHRLHVVPRLPVLAGVDHWWGYRRSPAQHRGREGARPATRPLNGTVPVRAWPISAISQTPLPLSHRNVGQDIGHMPGNVTDTPPLPLLPVGAGSGDSTPAPGSTGSPSSAGSPGRSTPVGYLGMLDFFRVAACACVLGQHSFIWTGMSHNEVGTGFITMLHFTRNAFFFLTGLVVCYAQITRPRSV